MAARKLYSGFLIILALSLWAPLAQASNISLDITVTNVEVFAPGYINIASNLSTVEGEAKYPVEPLVQRFGTDSASYTGGMWLYEMTAKNLPDQLSGKLVGIGPQSQGSNLGYLVQFAYTRVIISANSYYQIDDQNFDPTLAPYDFVGIHMNYSYTATLDQTGPNRFVDARWGGELSCGTEFSKVDLLPIIYRTANLDGEQDQGNGEWWTGFAYKLFWTQVFNEDGTFAYWQGEGWGEGGLALSMWQEAHTSVVPLPGGLLLLGSGLGRLLLWRRKKMAKLS